MKIYTKSGDRGKTNLFDGERIGKDNPRIKAYCSLDELTSFLGLVRSFSKSKTIKKIIEKLQEDLFFVGWDLATKKEKFRKKIKKIGEREIKFLEANIDKIARRVQVGKYFVFPGGSKEAAFLHVARTVCRRAEISVVELSKKEKINKNIIVYLNRLADLLFIMALLANKESRVKEREWKVK